MSRIKQRPDHINVSKKYVTNREQYEFGPLLIGKDAKLRLTDVEAEADTSAPDSKARRTAAITNAEMFRISNAGLTDAHIDFSFASDGELPFYVSPASLDLKEGETSSGSMGISVAMLGSMRMNSCVLLQTIRSRCASQLMLAPIPSLSSLGHGKRQVPKRCLKPRQWTKTRRAVTLLSKRQKTCKTCRLYLILTGFCSAALRTLKCCHKHIYRARQVRELDLAPMAVV